MIGKDICVSGGEALPGVICYQAFQSYSLDHRAHHSIKGSHIHDGHVNNLILLIFCSVTSAFMWVASDAEAQADPMLLCDAPCVWLHQC